MQEYFNRRAILLNKLPDKSVVTLFAAKILYRNHDCQYPFRQNSYFYYFTGIEDPELVLIMLKDANKVKSILFAKEQTKEEIIWHDRYVSHSEAIHKYGIDRVYHLADLPNKLPQLLAGTSFIWTLEHNMPTIKSWFKNTAHHKIIINNIATIVDEMRLIKSPEEIDTLRKVGKISSEAHLAVMQYCQTSKHEKELQGLFYQQCISNGCQALAYLPIIACGENAVILHYTKNNKPLNKNDLLLIDAGGELNNYATDITRTFPVSGKFSPAQKDLYTIVLHAQSAALNIIKPGIVWSAMQNKILEVLIDGLLELKILQGSKEEIFTNKTYRSVYMHNSGHWLGLDVHDVGNYQEGKRKLEPGMVLTVEPGIYINKNFPNIHKDFLGVGIRIEDTVCVTTTNYENFTTAPKSISNIEDIMNVD